MFGSLMRNATLRKTVRLTLGGSATLIGYNMLRSAHQEQQLPTVVITSKLTSHKEQTSASKVIATSESNWLPYSAEFPNWLWGRKDLRLTAMAKSSFCDAEKRCLALLQDPTCDKWAKDENGKDALYYAVVNGWENLVKELLKDKPTSVNAKYTRQHEYFPSNEPLFVIALEKQHYNVALLLIMNGANPDVNAYLSFPYPDYDGYVDGVRVPAICLAVYNDAACLVQTMLELNRDLNLIEKEDRRGNTPLFYTLNNGKLNVPLMQFLLYECGANPHHQNHEGKTFIFALEEAGYKQEAAQVCRKSGHKCHA